MLGIPKNFRTAFFAVSDGLTGLGGELLKRRTMSFLLRGVLIDTFISGCDAVRQLHASIK
ncbi:hypothetical protein CU663_20085 [Pseudomonas syringae pv. actinidifoliorum]|nr:hypothetical protein [Pseudomonas syringae pv. actinidifoliorum]